MSASVCTITRSTCQNHGVKNRLFGHSSENTVQTGADSSNNKLTTKNTPRYTFSERKIFSFGQRELREAPGMWFHIIAGRISARRFNHHLWHRNRPKMPSNRFLHHFGVFISQKKFSKILTQTPTGPTGGPRGQGGQNFENFQKFQKTHLDRISTN